MSMANVQDRGPPSAAAIAIGTAIISGVTGYFIGQGAFLFGSSRTRPQHAASSDTSDLEDEDEDEDVQDLGELKTFPGSKEECKMVLVVRTDLSTLR